MIQKIKKLVLATAAFLMLASPAVVPTAVGYAAANCPGVPAHVAQGASEASGGNVSCDPSGGINSSNAGSTISRLANTIVNIFSIVVGAAAIIMIIYAGFRYITSGGSSERIGNAKTTLIYAIIGLVVVALAQILVRFVLSTAVGAGDDFS